MQSFLENDVRFLKGVGEKRAKLYGKLGVFTVRDLLYHYPRSYLDLSAVYEIMQAPLEQVCAVRAVVVRKSGEQRIRKGMSLFKVIVADESGSMQITFFNAKYTVENLLVGETYLFYGRMSGSFLRREMAAPLVEPARQTYQLIPVYALTAGLSSRIIQKNVAAILERLGGQISETLPDRIRKEYHLAELEFALRNIHFPKDHNALLAARRRLVFEELFVLSLAMRQVKQRNVTKLPVRLVTREMQPFYDALPFQLTSAQKRAVDQCLHDLCGEIPMNRLVQGDVGSGKTMVAAACVYFTVQNQLQAAVMAPTEILAAQHFATFSKILAPFGITVALLTSSTKAAKKGEIYKGLENGEIQVCIGTHALLSEQVQFHNLALVVTDEQHRFGVSQRMALGQKGKHVHTLVMSATPIPRTLALIVYGDLDVSIIDELPPGRIPVKTYLIGEDKRARAYGFIRKHLDAGRQAYIVCPLVEQGEEPSPLKSVVEYAAVLSKQFFSDYQVGILHGQMKPKEKDAVMEAFQSGKTQLLISTTVIEVGVDVPNAVIMMIENAERFGLSQLHQLRGRVGRGLEQSHCILLSDAKAPETQDRMRMFCKTTDGFAIAEYDLKQRGPGDFFGYRQHGIPNIKIADLTGDVEILQDAACGAQTLLDEDAQLSAYPELRSAVARLTKLVGERPN